MNKVAITIALVAACVATSYGLPTPKVDKWDNVQKSVNAIQNLVQNNAESIRTIATNDNALVGGAIGVKIDLSLDQARPVLQQANAAIESRTLTAAGAQEMVGHLRGGIGHLKGEISADLGQLTLPAANQIRALFPICYNDLEIEAQALYGHLNAPEFTIQVVDWNAVANAVGVIAHNVSQVFINVTTTANNADATVGASISLKVDVARDNATVVLQQANAAVESQTLDETQAKAHVKEIKATMGILIGTLEDDLAMLLPPVAVYIRSILHDGFNTVEADAQQLYALLRL